MSEAYRKKFRQTFIRPFKNQHPKERVAKREYFWASKLEKRNTSTPDVSFQLLQSPDRRISLEVAQPDNGPILSMGLTLNERGDLIGLKDDQVTIRKPYEGHMWFFTYNIGKDDIETNNHKGHPQMVALNNVSRLRSDLASTDGGDGIPVKFTTINLPLEVADEIGIPRKFNWVDTAIAYLSGEVDAETALSSVVPLPQTEQFLA